LPRPKIFPQEGVAEDLSSSPSSISRRVGRATLARDIP
jgi:hypothetical protein